MLELRISALHVVTFVIVSTESAVTDITFSPCEKKRGGELISYCAEEGDSLWEIAKKFRVPPEKIAARNGLEGDRIKKSQMIFIAD